MGKNITIYDVAEHSGVSVASVSRVLAHAEYPVSDITRQKVLKAAKELNYTVNVMGKILKTQSTREIGVIVPNISNPSYAQLVQGIQSTAIQNDYHILLYNSYRDGETESRNLRMMLEKRVDGILLVGIGGNQKLLDRARALERRLIMLEQVRSMDAVHVGYDYARSGETATKHLLDCGHRRIGFLGARIDRPSRARMLQGYRQALQLAGLPDRAEYIWLSQTERETDCFEIENGMAGAQHFIRLEQRPTGYVCLNDLTALSAMRTFAAAGFSIPQDISIVGFDNISFGELSTPTLTTIDQRAEEMGRIAMDMMLQMIRHPEEPLCSVELEPVLVVRGSVAAPPTIT